MTDLFTFLNDGWNFFGVIVLVAVTLGGIAGIVRAFRKPKPKISREAKKQRLLD